MACVAQVGCAGRLLPLLTRRRHTRRTWPPPATARGRRPTSRPRPPPVSGQRWSVRRFLTTRRASTCPPPAASAHATTRAPRALPPRAWAPRCCTTKVRRRCWWLEGREGGRGALLVAVLGGLHPQWRPLSSCACAARRCHRPAGQGVGERECEIRQGLQRSPAEWAGDAQVGCGGGWGGERMWARARGGHRSGPRTLERSFASPPPPLVQPHRHPALPLCRAGAAGRDGGLGGLCLPAGLSAPVCAGLGLLVLARAIPHCSHRAWPPPALPLLPCLYRPVWPQVYPRTFIGDTSMYERSWWQLLVGGWEAVVYNPGECGGCRDAEGRLHFPPAAVLPRPAAVLPRSNPAALAQ